MIDTHVHTKHSHHGSGDLEDYVLRARELGLQVLGFTEHAPFIYDFEHRLTKEETFVFLDDIDRLKEKYAGQLTILAGLEMDYTPSGRDFTMTVAEQVLDRVDYLFGGVHFIEFPERREDIWSYAALHEEEVIERYFMTLDRAINEGIFDAVVHPDSVLRAGVDIELLKPYFKSVWNACIKNDVCYELNCSGLSKDSYDPVDKKMVAVPSYPHLELAYEAYDRGVGFVIGSDAHQPERLAKNIAIVLENLRSHNVGAIHYFENGQKKDFLL